MGTVSSRHGGGCGARSFQTDSMRVTFGQMDSMRAPICSGGFAEERSDGINDGLHFGQID
jgi:hypothetical protein